MIAPRPVLHVIGLLLIPMGLGMLVPVVVDLAFASADWQVFLASAVLTLFIGATLAVVTRDSGELTDLKQAFLLTTLAWIVLPAFAALPFAFSALELSYTDSFFEAMSGLTTTGSTIIEGLDAAPPGLLFWRATLQWLGGVGIIVMAIAVLPMLRVGGMQIFRMEASDTFEKILPRAGQISGAIFALYLALSLLCFLLLLLAGLSAFDAVTHTMTTIATGGFSTKDASIGYFDSALVDFIVILFMIIGSLPFILYLQAMRGRSMALWKDTQVQAFLVVVSVLIVLVTIWLVVARDFEPLTALRYGSFNVLSIMTGTGFSTTDYFAWGGFSVALFFVIMFIGGCAGSTTCGIKIFRFQVLLAIIWTQLRRINRPNGVFVPHFNHRPIDDHVAASVMSYMFLFILSFVLIAALLAALGLDFITALSSAGTALANVGPGLGPVVGPAGTFASLPDSAKWVMSFAMLLGRLELFTVLVLFTPAFWRA